MKDLLKRLLVEEEGQGITEYALILGLIVFGVWVLINSSNIGEAITTLFTNVTGEIGKCSVAWKLRRRLVVAISRRAQCYSVVYRP